MSITESSTNFGSVPAANKKMINLLSQLLSATDLLPIREW